jgi:hypothetical protein
MVMDYETEIIDGRKAVVRHFFKAHEIQVGSRWARADGSKGYVTVEGFNTYGSTNPWIEVVYSWELNGEKFTHEKDVFIFQSKYCLIVED